MMPLAKVWQAWTDSQSLMQWWGPQGFTCPLARIDLREGGTSLVAMRSPEHGTHYSIWHYQRIVPHQQLEFVHNLADASGNKINPVTVGMPPDFPMDQRQVIAFEALPGDKTALTVTEYGWTVGQMMEFSRMGMEQSLDKLAAVLARG